MRAGPFVLLGATMCTAACGSRSALWEAEPAEGTTGTNATTGTTDTTGSVDTTGPVATTDTVPTGTECSGGPCEKTEYWSLSLEAGEGIAVVSDSDGNVVLLTGCNGVDFDGVEKPGVGVCLAKMDAVGTVLWSKAFEGLPDGGIGVDDAGNVWVTGTFQSLVELGGPPLKNDKLGADVLLAKLDPDGNHLFSASFGDEGGGMAYQYGRRLTVSPDGSVFVVGDFLGTLSLGGDTFSAFDDYDGFVARFDASGNHLWSRALQGTKWQHVDGLVALADGSAVVTGTFDGSIDCGGGLLDSAGEQDIFVAKLDAAGNHVFSRRYGGPGMEHWPRLAAGAEGTFFLGGGFWDPFDFGATPLVPDGKEDLFIGRLSAEGEPIDARTFPGDSASYIHGLCTNEAGEAILSGSFDGSMQIGPSSLSSPFAAFVARLDAAGEPLWGRPFGEGEYIDAHDVALDPKGNLLVTGMFYLAAIDFGDEQSPHSTDGSAMFVAKLPP